ncbi:Rod shape-determining protein MreD [Candidatus Erwinia haradaeae]|uniref:Rod shape-determining protein MreD n=1 Tax=Candidatus Erwinia haradaeae TaxID=1922217 RepID=A0A451DJN8_9GAMM|nr:rod shape-determining protein MreD [Candidatus Erwinia haradaeae]VFP86893.1 Rod shape-determining protein MreD [Candidatus Erwinia haradaeae]
MRDYHSPGYLVIWLSFLAAILLYIFPWPKQLLLFQPSWLLLIMIYWIVSLPYLVNIGTGFIIGFIIDLLYGSTLGIHALAFSVVAYLVAQNFCQFNRIKLYQQVIVVIGFSWVADIIIYFIELLFIRIAFFAEHIWNGLINGIVWPWLYLLMKRICNRFSVL